MGILPVCDQPMRSIIPTEGGPYSGSRREGSEKLKARHPNSVHFILDPCPTTVANRPTFKSSPSEGCLEFSGSTTPVDAPDTTVPVPVSAATVATPPTPWSPATRFGFRIAFLYFFCFIFLFGNGTLFGAFPVVGRWIEGKLNWPFNHLSEFTGQHLFHLRPARTRPDPIAEIIAVSIVSIRSVIT